MNKRLVCVLMAVALGLPLAGHAQQTCQSESAIPSSTPGSRFSDHGDGTVTDSGTGLMWAKCAAGLSGANCGSGSASTFTWQGALNHAAGSGHAGYSDWRLPTVAELNSIVEQRCINPAINTTVFPNTPVSGFWSASPSAHLSDNAWYVSFDGGYSYDGYGYGYRGDGLHVRLVRAGQ